MKKINNALMFFIFCVVLFFLYLVIRNTGLYATIFSDEYHYSRLSRLLPLEEAYMPNYLYLKIYSITNYCGDGFLGCAKIINSFFFISATPFIYLIARRVVDQRISVLVSLLAVIGPINAYTAFFMPESIYFLSFWMFCFYLLSLCSESTKWSWFIAGAAFAVSALMKPHSILFLPAILIYISFILLRERCFFSRSAVLVVSAFLLGALITKFGLSYILAGSAGLTFFGPRYSSIAASTASGTEKYIQLMLLALESLKGHVLVIGLLYGLPLVLAVDATARMLFVRNDPTDNGRYSTTQYEKIAFLSLVVIFNLICVVALFTAAVASPETYETPYRLHMRYYNYALPLFYLVAAGAFRAIADVNRLSRYLLGGIIVATGILAIWNNLAPYTPYTVDSPEVRGLHFNHLYFQIIGGLLISAIPLWLISQRNGLRLYLYFSLPLFVVVSTYHIGLDLNNRLKQNVYDKAGIFTKNYLTDEDLSKTVIVGSDPSGLFLSLYYLDNVKSSLEIIQRAADYDLAKLPAGKEWLLVIGDHEIKGMPFYEIPMDGFVLIRASGEILDFKKGVWPGIIRKVKGLSMPEPWGTWSQSDILIFEFAGSLPSKFQIQLAAKAFGTNVDKEFEASVGDDVAKFSLSANVEQKMIRLNNPKGSNVLRFKIPTAVSPMALGLSDDDRSLGIGFVEMKIDSIK